MTKLVYRGIEFDTAAVGTKAKAQNKDAQLVYRGVKNDNQAATLATIGAGTKGLTYRGFRFDR